MAQAIDLLDQHAKLRVLRRASFYETEPVGIEDQRWFLNTIVEVDTTLSPEALLNYCKFTERTLGRIPRQRWGPRELDVDLILYGPWVIRVPQLVVPHPQMRVRNFVLLPLLELASDIVDPVTRKGFVEIAAQLKDSKKVELSKRKS